ncbi:MAG: tRNA pseudouridine(55) synthase TruB [Nocardioidaceae bacterium]
MPALDGLLIVDKPPGWTSHDVVGRCRRLAHTRKVGHAGTLDPMATGVLVVGVARATRLLGHLALSDKAYDATIRFGQSTVTDDAQGEVLTEHDASGIDHDALTGVLSGLTGDIEQVPAAVSAIKIGGQRAYRRVRAGEDVALAPRRVTVWELSLVSVRRIGPLLDADVHAECSTGTYVRALARDAGRALGVGGHLTMLRRTRVGPYGVQAARTLDQLEHQLAVVTLEEAVADNFATYTVAADQVLAVSNGRALDVTLGVAGPVAVLAPSGEFLALYQQSGTVAKAVAVFSPAVSTSRVDGDHIDGV